MELFEKTFVIFFIFTGFINVESARRQRLHKNRQLQFTRDKDLSMTATNCNNNLCTEVEDYPTKYIEGLIKRGTEFGYFNGTIIKPHKSPMVEGKSPKATKTEFENLCKSSMEIATPKAAFNTRNQKRIIVNIKGAFEQDIYYEKCSRNIDSPGHQSCFGGNRIPEPFEAACKQQYNVIRLVTFSENGNLELDYYRVPSSCACSYRRKKN